MIRIVTDTASDITPAQAAQMQVELVELPVLFEQQPYDGRQDEGFAGFYKKLGESKSLPQTSQAPPSAFLDIFLQAKKAGDAVVVITLSGALSGTVQSANVAAGMAEYDPVFVVDSRSAVIGQRLLVEYAVKLRAAGRTAAQIAAEVQQAAGRVVLYGALDTLKYLRRGGRIPKAAELLGTMMGIKPIITVENGAIAMAAKARGYAGAVTGIMKLVEKQPGFDDSMPVYFGYSCVEQSCRKFRRLATTHFRLRQTAIYPVGPIVGTHIGPGAFAIAYLALPTQQNSVNGGEDS